MLMTKLGEGPQVVHICQNVHVRGRMCVYVCVCVCVCVSESVVRGMKWTADGQKICIVYEDGMEFSFQMLH